MTNRTFKSLYSLPSPVNAYCVIVEELNGSVNWLPDNDESMAFPATQRKLMKPKCALSWSSSTDNIQNMKPVLAIFSEISINSKANYHERRQWYHLITFLFFSGHISKSSTIPGIHVIILLVVRIPLCHLFFVFDKVHISFIFDSVDRVHILFQRIPPRGFHPHNEADDTDGLDDEERKKDTSRASKSYDEVVWRSGNTCSLQSFQTGLHYISHLISLIHIFCFQKSHDHAQAL